MQNGLFNQWLNIFQSIYFLEEDVYDIFMGISLYNRYFDAKFYQNFINFNQEVLLKKFLNVWILMILSL